MTQLSKHFTAEVQLMVTLVKHNKNLVRILVLQKCLLNPTLEVQSLPADIDVLWSVLKDLDLL